MNSDQAQDRKLVEVLRDATAACLWTAVVLYALVILSWLVYLVARPSILETFAPGFGVSAEAMAVVWLSALALVKVVAVTFVAMAVGLWTWKRRLLRRLGQ